MPKRMEKKRKPWPYLGLIALLVVIGVALYQVPAIHDRAYFHFATLRAKVFFFFKPPASTTFDPSANQTPTGSAPTGQPAATSTPVPTPTAPPEPTPGPTLAPTAIPTPLPESVSLGGITLQPQAFNNCGPATLSMNLEFWGWEGFQSDIQRVIKPRLEDLSVTPAELVAFVEGHTDFKALVRQAGTLDLLKRFIAAGIPFMVERGYFVPSDGWMGHFGVINGYDDAAGTVHIPDSFSGIIDMRYEDLQRFWDQFNNTYLVVYPPEREAEVMALLGADADADANLEKALHQARSRAKDLTGQQQFFAAYSTGSILVQMQRWEEAAAAYDTAFALYNALYQEDRPWRLFWYETGAYEAYYHTGRYQDVLGLADKVLDETPSKGLPETYLWRARANVALGDEVTAAYDYKRALTWHPNWQPALDGLAELGVAP